MKINMKKKTIELTKEEMKKASIYGSPDYVDLQGARRDNPGYTVVVVKRSGRKADFASLTMAQIRTYVEEKGDTQQQEAFEIISKKTVDEEGNYHEAQSFFEIKKWFLNEFPELKQQRKDYREKVLGIYQAAEKKAEAAAKAAAAIRTAENNPAA